MLLGALRWRNGLVAALLALSVVGVPAAAEEGIHLQYGEVRENGCQTLEVWNNDLILRVIEPFIPVVYHGPVVTCGGVDAVVVVEHQARVGRCCTSTG